MRVVYLGGKASGASCLQVLLGQCDVLGIELAGVAAAGRDGGIGDIARAANVAVFSEPDAIPECDLLISVQYDRILKARHIAKARRIAVNLHFAPLPEYRGCNQFSLAILDKRAEFGVTLHELDEGVDSGPILFERRFSIPENIWVDQLHEMTLKEAEILFVETLPLLVSGQFERRPQSDYVAERGEPRVSMRREIEELKQIDLSCSAEEIERRIRATAMPGFAPPYTMVAGERISLIRSRDTNS